MISYNPKNWFALIFKFHKSDTFRQLFGLMFILGLYAFFVAYFELHVFNAKFKTTTAMHSMLGVVIGLLLVFRTNTAYERWWEGRKLWGSLLNTSRNIAIKLQAILPKNDVENKTKSAQLLANFATALQVHLTHTITKSKQSPALPQHQPNMLAIELATLMHELYITQKITDNQWLALSNDVNQLTDITGACERIKRTPIPFSYSLFIKKFIFLYIMTMPFCFASDFGYWMVPVTIMFFYVLVSLELIAEEIEDPFGEDANDLPMTSICENIKISTADILGTNNTY